MGIWQDATYRHLRSAFDSLVTQEFVIRIEMCVEVDNRHWPIDLIESSERRQGN